MPRCSSHPHLPSSHSFNLSPSPRLKYPLLLFLPFFSPSSLELSLLPPLTSLPARPSVSYHILLFLSPFSHLSPRTNLCIWMVGTQLGDAISEKPCTDEKIHCCFASCRIHESKKKQLRCSPQIWLKYLYRPEGAVFCIHQSILDIESYEKYQQKGIRFISLAWFSMVYCYLGTPAQKLLSSYNML